MTVPLLTTRRFWRERQAEGWVSVWALADDEDDEDLDDETRHPDWLALTQLEAMAYDHTERCYPGTMPFGDEDWVLAHLGVLFYPHWALASAWARLVRRKQVCHPRLAPR